MKPLVKLARTLLPIIAVALTTGCMVEVDDEELGVSEDALYEAPEIVMHGDAEGPDPTPWHVAAYGEESGPDPTPWEEGDDGRPGPGEGTFGDPKDPEGPDPTPWRTTGLEPEEEPDPQPWHRGLDTYGTGG